MKKILAILLSLCLIISIGMFSTTAVLAEDATTVRLGGLKGPTSMGMVKLLNDNENGLTAQPYEFTMAITADELTPKLLKDELDILSVPANLAAILYNNTKGAVQMLAINTLGVVYLCEKGESTIKSIEDLKGQTIYATGKGSTPEFVLSYLLAQHGLNIETDVMMEWVSEPTETIATIATKEHAVAMLPQPFLTVAQAQIEGLSVVLDLNKEWEALQGDSLLVTSGIIVRKAFAEEHPEAVAQFMAEYQASVEWINSNVEEGAKLVEKYGIVKEAIAKKAIPACNLVYIDGAEMKATTQAYLEVLFAQKPEIIGTALPDDAFYYVK